MCVCVYLHYRLPQHYVRLLGDVLLRRQEMIDQLRDAVEALSIQTVQILPAHMKKHLEEESKKKKKNILAG